jgi:outer membrane protein OmpA-like peptidoglycan-associated protein
MKCLFILLLTAFSIQLAAQEKDTVFIYFDFDQASLRPDGKAALDDFIRRYKNNEVKATLEISGHCDFIGSDSYNNLLSRKRSFTVHEYLLNNGIPKTSVAIVEGFGERMPRNLSRGPEERALNRRVELISSSPLPSATPPRKDTVTDFSKQIMDSVRQGQTLRLKNINFYGGRHTFLPQAEGALNELLDVMKTHPTLEIEIQGHICCQYGSERDGLDYDSGDDRLSYNRARAVYYFLANNGIDKRRMTFRGFAATIPLVYPEYTEEDRTANRRVEIKITRR